MGDDVILEIELIGARAVRKTMPEAISVFIAPPSMAELAERLRGRGTETAAAIVRRLDRAETEVAAAEEFDHVVVNDEAGRAADEVAAIIEDRGVKTSGQAPHRRAAAPRDGSRYELVMIAAKRARQINNYYHSLGENTLGLEELTPPLITTRSTNLLTIAFEEIVDNKIDHENPELTAAVSGRLPTIPCRPHRARRCHGRHRHLQGRGAGAGLVKDGFQPLVVTTEAAQRFVMPLTFAAVSQAPVLDDQSAWQASGGWFQHIEAARTASVMVVAPATANTLAKMAAGMADNLLTAIYLAFRGPVIVAPTMNWAMNEHAATRENLRVLAERGVEVLPTEEGELACGEEGSGRMASPDAIRAGRAPGARRRLRRAARRQEGGRHLRRHP